jgi:hypothetical protein
MDQEYYDRQEERGAAAARVIVICWLFLSGAAAGWIGRGLW